MSPWAVVRDREGWLAQAKGALRRLEERGLTIEGVTTGTIDDALKVDRQAVADLLQAFDALGVNVAPDLLQRAGLVSVAQELGLPEAMGPQPGQVWP